MLKVSNLQVRLEEENKAILKGVDLEVRAGEVPLYGTCSIFTSASILKSSAARNAVLPVPAEA